MTSPHMAQVNDCTYTGSLQEELWLADDHESKNLWAATAGTGSNIQQTQVTVNQEYM